MNHETWNFHGKAFDQDIQWDNLLKNKDDMPSGESIYAFKFINDYQLYN